MHYLLASVKDATVSIAGNSAHRVYKVSVSIQHGVSAVLTWPWKKRIIRCFMTIIHRRVRYRVTVDGVPPQLICARCNQVPSVPKITGCSKTVCRRCVGYHNQCPFCTNMSCVASHNSEYAREISKLKAKCPTPQCKWFGKVEEVTEHLQKCAEATITCPQCGTSILRKLQFKHEDCCPLQIKNCFYCRKEGYAKDIIAHEERECPLRKIECPNGCGDLDIFHDQLEVHLQEQCLLRLVSCNICKEVYRSEDFEQHPCERLPYHQKPREQEPTGENHKEETFGKRLVPTDYMNAKGKLPSSDLKGTREKPEEDVTPSGKQLPPTDHMGAQSNLPSSNSKGTATPIPVGLQTTIPIAEYTIEDNTKSKAEALQRLVVSCITLCLLSTIVYLRNQRITDVEFEHDMEIPSVLLWSIFTSVLVFLVILGGSNWYKNLFKNINAKECTVIALAISFIHLIRFYPNSCLPMILGSLCGSTVEVFLFYKHVTKSSDKFTNTVWIMTQFVAIILTPFIIIYYSSISNLRVAIMQLIYIIYIVILRKKQGLEKCWDNMTQENRTVGIYLVNGIVLFSITLYSVTAISYELFSTSFSSLKIILAAVLPIAYFYIMAMEQVQDVMLKFGEKLYRSNIYSFWGRLCMVSIFYYTMIICLVIPIVQETGDFIVGSALASVLIVYSIIVQTGLFSKDGVQQILKDPSDALNNPPKSYGILLQDLLLKVRFVKTADIYDNTSPNTTTLLLFAELESVTSDTLIKDTKIMTTYNVEMKKDDSVHTLSLSVTNKQWTSSNETISFTLQNFFGFKNKLGNTCLELSKWERYLNNEKAVTLNIQLNNNS